MRILELHSPYFRALWRRAGHEVLAWGPHPECDFQTTAAALPLGDLLRALPAGWSPDLIVLGDDCRLLRVLGLEDAPCPTLMISIDAHHNSGWHGVLAASFDVACVAQRDFMPGYEAPAVHWLPCWAPDDLPPPAAEKRYEVSFVGRLDGQLNPERVVFFEALRARLPIHVAEGAYADVFTQSRVVVNQTVRGDLNARVFEAMACGALLVTERTTNGLLDLFGEGEHLVTYPRGDVAAAAAVVERWLADERGRAAIAGRGHAAARTRHLEHHRAAAVLAHAAAAPARRPAAVTHAGAARAYAMLGYCAGRLAEVYDKERFYPVVREVYLHAAETIAAGSLLEEPERYAVRGMVAFERGEVAEAATLLGRAAEGRSRPEDHLLRIAALMRAGDVRAARAAAERLCVAHPGHAAGRALANTLAETAAGA